MDILITMIATALIFLSGVGIGAAITDRIITEEEKDDKDTTEAIRGSDDRAGSKDLMDI